MIATGTAPKKLLLKPALTTNKDWSLSAPLFWSLDKDSVWDYFRPDLRVEWRQPLIPEPEYEVGPVPLALRLPGGVCEAGQGGCHTLHPNNLHRLGAGWNTILFRNWICFNFF